MLKTYKKSILTDLTGFMKIAEEKIAESGVFLNEKSFINFIGNLNAFIYGSCSCRGAGT